jgi:hypothetical protein
MSIHADRAPQGSARPRTGLAPASRRRRPRVIRHASPVALEYAQDVARRVSNRPAPVRNGFIERLHGETELPPLAAMIRGGQGGAVRLKVYLSMLWFAVRPPHDTSYPARGWAGLLDLPDPDTNGARRVAAAIDWLDKHNLVHVERKPGQPSVVYLRDERGTGQLYQLPFRVMKAKEDAGEVIDRDDYWVGLPATFWTKGWLAVLSPAAVAMLLVMIDESRYSGRTDRLWHSPSQAERRFGLSQDTRSAGLQDLAFYKIVTMRRSSISPGVFDFKRLRNVYDLHLEQLTVEPGQPRPAGVTITPEVLAEESREVDRGLTAAALAQ